MDLKNKQTKSNIWYFTKDLLQLWRTHTWAQSEEMKKILHTSESQKSTGTYTEVR